MRSAAAIAAAEQALATGGNAADRVPLGDDEAVERHDRDRAYDRSRRAEHRRILDTTRPSEKLAAQVTRYRLAIEIGRSGIRSGHIAEALEFLDAAVAHRYTEDAFVEALRASVFHDIERTVTASLLAHLAELGVDLTPAREHLPQTPDGAAAGRPNQEGMTA